MKSKTFDIAAYLEDKLAKFKLSAGSELTGVCPVEDCGRYGGFYVNSETGAWLCNKCGGRGRGIASLVEIIEGLAYHEAVAFVFRRSVELRRRETLATLRERLQALRPHSSTEEVPEITYVDDPLPGEFRPCYRAVKGKPAWQLPPYLKERRIKSATIKAWGMGYCRAGRYAGRLIIPVECPNGKSFTARDMFGDQIPKYMNPTGTDFRRLLIGWNLARLTGDVVLCEGPLDAVMLYQHGISALSLGGKELHDEQMAMLMSLPSDTNVIIMLDPEEDLAPWKLALKLSVHFRNILVSKLLPVDGGVKRGVDKEGKPVKLDPGNSTFIEADGAILQAMRWTGSRAPLLRAKLLGARKSTLSRWS
jgi:DNA primase